MPAELISVWRHATGAEKENDPGLFRHRVYTGVVIWDGPEVPEFKANDDVFRITSDDRSLEIEIGDID